MTEGRTDKVALRRIAERVRTQAAVGAPLASAMLTAWAPAWLITGARVVSGYWPFRNEIDPRPLMRRFLAAGATLALPVTPPRGGRKPLTFRAWRPGDRLEKGTFGMLEPVGAAPEVQPDLILLPLLAFDRDGGRLGYGGGHYDRTLAALRTTRSVFALGVGFAAQEMTVPCEPHDQSLDAILTERGFIQVGTIRA